MLIRRIRQMAALADGASLCSAIVKTASGRRQEYFERIGMPAHLKGYRYLIEALVFVVMDHSWLIR